MSRKDRNSTTNQKAKGETSKVSEEFADEVSFSGTQKKSKTNKAKSHNTKR
ncbi:hypothetical protein [Clostridium hydrogenum]|uniref:hypothetical protein n=1 Tax=Clostridium hydrogenum TaxID=2855764 RepID=UPI001F202476|nr:hypothetical protein [Clostridium hydrogenum]